MASSLSPECTPLKVTYDTCFNAWFEGYLEPAVAAQPAERAAHSKAKAEEYEAKCGGLWKEYKTCIDVRIDIWLCSGVDMNCLCADGAHWCRRRSRNVDSAICLLRQDKNNR
jgi:hypothetical protein